MANRMTSRPELSSGADRATRFLHVPKTAGTSVNVFLDRFHPVETIWGFRDYVPLEDEIVRLRSLDPAKRRAIRLFRGHAPLVTGESDVDGARTFTLLRDPVQRVMSYCCHVADGKANNLGPDFTPEKFSLREFLDSGCHELRDLQTRMLLGEVEYERLLGRENEAAFREALAEAFGRIELVGVQERYEDVMIVGMLVFGWPRINPRKRVNVRREDNPLRFSDEDVGKIARMNRWDALAHRMAAEVFDAAYRRHAARAAALKFKFAVQRCVASVKGRLAGWVSPRGKVNGLVF